jgi:hypothetical protein
MALYELELRRADRRELRVIDRLLTLGETVEIEGELWRVLRLRQPSPNSDAKAHYVCEPLRAEVRSFRGDAA